MMNKREEMNVEEMNMVAGGYGYGYGYGNLEKSALRALSSVESELGKEAASADAVSLGNAVAWVVV